MRLSFALLLELNAALLVRLSVALLRLAARVRGERWTGISPEHHAP